MWINTPENIFESIPQPEGDDVIIWRYMDFTKYVSLLETSSLFFARVSQLADLFEGSFPQSQPPLVRFLQMLPKDFLPQGVDVAHMPSHGLLEYGKAMRNWTMVNCWHAVDHESAAMWSLYAQSGNGVAIRSTVGLLRQALGTPPEVHDGFFHKGQFHIGMIEYIDYTTSHISPGHGAAPFFRKRRSFEHEKELRAVVMQLPVDDRRWLDYSQHFDDAGKLFPVDLKTLICAIRVAPQAPLWYSDLVSRVTVRYGLEVKPLQSELDAEPLY